jgi:hypothetical protein
MIISRCGIGLTHAPMGRGLELEVRVRCLDDLDDVFWFVGDAQQASSLGPM